MKKFKEIITILKKKYLHFKWQCRYNKAWNIACHKAYDGYNEDIATCHPLFYFQNELNGLKNYR